jgi:hypothetical protein
MKYYEKKFKSDFENLVFLKKDFVVKKSSSTVQIHYAGEKEIYSDSRMSFNVIHRAKDLKKELKNHLPKFENDEKEVGYYLYGSVDFENKKIYNIDISSAYLTILRNTCLISEQLFTKINLLPKTDRLKILGMLAYQPFSFFYEKGKLEYSSQEKNEYRNVFFYCVRETFRIMKIIQKKIGKDFLFSWVDGVYFTGEYNINLVSDILRSHKLKFTTERLLIFNAKKSDELAFYTYEKFSHKKKKFEQKNICVPDNNFRRIQKIAFDFNNAMEKKDNEKMLEICNEYLEKRLIL